MVSAVFLPVLVLLFGLAIPLGWVQPDYGHLHAVLSYPAHPAGRAGSCSC